MSGPTNYQWVITSTNYDGTAAPKSLRFDGIDDYLNLPYMGLYANGSASVISATSLLPTNNNNAVYSLNEGSGTDINPIYAFDVKPITSSCSGVFIRSNTGGVMLDTTTLTQRLSAIAGIASYIDTGSTMTTYANASVLKNSIYSRTGVLTSNRMTYGALGRVGVSLFNSFNSYGLIITKSALSDKDRRRCEQFLASRLTSLGVTLS